MSGDWEKVGDISVDAGCVMVGDPCYTQGKDATNASESWMDFLAQTYPAVFGPNTDYETGGKMRDAVNALGKEGLGIVVSSGYGDGSYPVYVRREGGRVAELRVVFIGNEDREDLCPDCGSEPGEGHDLGCEYGEEYERIYGGG